MDLIHVPYGVSFGRDHPIVENDGFVILYIHSLQMYFRFNLEIDRLLASRNFSGTVSFPSLCFCPI